MDLATSFANYVHNFRFQVPLLKSNFLGSLSERPKAFGLVSLHVTSVDLDLGLLLIIFNIFLFYFLRTKEYLSFL